MDAMGIIGAVFIAIGVHGALDRNRRTPMDIFTDVAAIAIGVWLALNAVNAN
jgi:hypothetical protein